MPGIGRTLRVTILGVKVKEPRRYHINIQCLVPGQPPIGVLGMGDEARRPDMVARTETSEVSRSPDFLNRCFVLRLPQPLGGNNMSPSAALQVSLMAMPSMEGQPGLMVAGREIDELMGQATLQIGGDVAQRLLRGEHVTLPVVLGGTDPYDPHGVGQNLDLLNSLGVPSGAGTSMYGQTGREVLLELLLLDADVSLPRDVYAMKAHPNALYLGGGPPARQECMISVLVTRAENLPTIRGDSGVEEAPSTFVAITTAKDTRERLPPQAVSKTAASSHNPFWGEVLQIRIHEDELPNEKLYISLTNDLNSRLMLKCSLPTAHLLPHVHYNLQLMLPGGPLGSSVVLYVTLCLTNSPRMAVRRVQNATKGGQVDIVMEASFLDSSKPLSKVAALVQAPEDPEAFSEVFAVWRMGPAIVPPAHGWQPPSRRLHASGRGGSVHEAMHGHVFEMAGGAGHTHVGAKVAGHPDPGAPPHPSSAVEAPPGSAQRFLNGPQHSHSSNMSITRNQPPAGPWGRDVVGAGGLADSFDVGPPLDGQISTMTPLQQGAASPSRPLGESTESPRSKRLLRVFSGSQPPGSETGLPMGMSLPGNGEVSHEGSRAGSRGRGSAGSRMAPGPMAEGTEGAPAGDPSRVEVHRRGPRPVAEGTEGAPTVDPSRMGVRQRGPGPVAEGTVEDRLHAVMSRRLPRGPGPVAEGESGRSTPSGQASPSGVNLAMRSGASSAAGTPIAAAAGTPLGGSRGGSAMGIPVNNTSPFMHGPSPGTASPMGTPGAAAALHDPHAHGPSRLALETDATHLPGQGSAAAGGLGGGAMGLDALRLPSGGAGGGHTPLGSSRGGVPGADSGARQPHHSGGGSRRGVLSAADGGTGHRGVGSSVGHHAEDHGFDPPGGIPADPYAAAAAGAAGALRTVYMPLPLDVSRIYTIINGASEEEANKAIMALSEELSSPKLGAVLDVVPVALLQGMALSQPYPKGHTSTLLTATSYSMAVKCELHQMIANEMATLPIGYAEVPSQALEVNSEVEIPYERIPLCMGVKTDGTHINVKIHTWDIIGYEKAQGRKAPADARSLDAPNHGPGAGGDAAMMSGMTWQGTPADPNSSRSAALLETLVDDLVLKQMALERQIRNMDTNDARAEMAIARLQDAEGRCRNLTDDNNHLRQLIHEDKEATRLPQILENAANLSRDELIDRAEAALGAYARERRRNGELVHRLQQMHEEQVDMLELKRRYQELQAAHQAQAKFMNDTNHKNGKLEAFRKTVKTQEEVINNLEHLLVQAVAKARENGHTHLGLSAPPAASPDAVAAAVDSFEQPGSLDPNAMEKIGMLEQQKDEALQENFELKMKLKMEEERTRAAKAEVIDSVRRYAKEIADLKFKLAEKDAQLMGGFGDVERLRNLDDDLGIPMVQIPVSPPTGGGSPDKKGRGSRSTTPGTSRSGYSSVTPSSVSSHTTSNSSNSYGSGSTRSAHSSDSSRSSRPPRSGSSGEGGSSYQSGSSGSRTYTASTDRTSSTRSSRRS